MERKKDMLEPPISVIIKYSVYILQDSELTVYYYILMVKFGIKF